MAIFKNLFKGSTYQIISIDIWNEERNVSNNEKF